MALFEYPQSVERDTKFYYGYYIGNVDTLWGFENVFSTNILFILSFHNNIVQSNAYRSAKKIPS